MDKGFLVIGIVFFIGGTLVANYSYFSCKGISFGCHPYASFPYGLGMIIIGACCVGITLVINRRKEELTPENQHEDSIPKRFNKTDY